MPFFARAILAVTGVLAIAIVFVLAVTAVAQLRNDRW